MDDNSVDLRPERPCLVLHVVMGAVLIMAVSVSPTSGIGGVWFVAKAV
ncbi:MAG: hypothetical protein GXP36_12420 [Actinobacteria bacterium]|nr:hypothetical protein [Actinomycetota bacterium]